MQAGPRLRTLTETSVRPVLITRKETRPLKTNGRRLSVLGHQCLPIPGGLWRENRE